MTRLVPKPILYRERMVYIWWWWSYGAVGTKANLVSGEDGLYVVVVLLWWWFYYAVVTEADVVR